MQFFATGKGKRETVNAEDEARCLEAVDGCFSTPAAALETAARRAEDVTTTVTLSYTHWPCSHWGFQTDFKAASEFFLTFFL